MKCKKIAKTSHPISKCRIWMVFSPLFALSVIRQFLHHSHHIFPTAIFFALSWRFCVKNIGHAVEAKVKEGREEKEIWDFFAKIMQCCTLRNWIIFEKNYQKCLTFQKLPKISHIRKITKNNLTFKKLPKKSHWWKITKNVAYLKITKTITHLKSLFLENYF